METQNELEVGLGNLEPEKKTLEAKPVKVVSIAVKEVKANLSKKVVFTVKHPDKDELIEISSAKIIGSDDKVKAVGTWFSLDKEGKLQKSSTIYTVLKHYGKSSLKELEGTEVNTATNETGYLCLKAY